MEKEDIISSGLLELYAAGIASEEESRDVEQWVAQYPEVSAELQKISAGVEAYANAYAIAPASNVKEKIFATININSVKANQYNKAVLLDTPPEGEAKVIDIKLFWKMAAAASVILLIGSISLNIVTYNKYSEADKRLSIAQETLGSLEEKNKVMENDMHVIQSKYSVPVALNGLEAAPEAAAKVFWMKNTGEVFIDPSNLPDAPAGKQYQLWGIVDGKPVDGGMILTSKNGNKYRIQKMKNFGKVEAFAVTLEAEQGNTAPKGPMYVMGKM